MTPREKFAFLDAKRKLLQPLVEGAEAMMLKMNFERMIEMGVDAIPAESQAAAFGEIDRKLERLIVEWVVEADEAAIRAQLKKQFGFSSFGDQPVKTLRRILRDKRIRNEDEAKLVQDYLAGSYLGWTANEKRLKAFNGILAAYDCRDKRSSGEANGATMT